MKRILTLLLGIFLLCSLCACGERVSKEEPEPRETVQKAPNKPTQSDAVELMQYQWDRRVNMKLLVPEGWCCEADECNQFGVKARNEDAPDTVGFDFWLAAAPEMRFSFQCWTHTFGMCGTGVDFQHYDGEHKLTVATEGADNGKSVQVTIIFNEVPGNYVVTGSVPAELWMAYQDRVIGIVDSATVGEGCMSYAEAAELASEAIPGITEAPEGGFYDVMTGQWCIVWRDGMEVHVEEDGSTMVLDATPKA